MTIIVVLNAQTDCSVQMYARSSKQWILQWTGTHVQLHRRDRSTVHGKQSDTDYRTETSLQSPVPQDQEESRWVVTWHRKCCPSCFNKWGEDIANLGFDYVNGSKLALNHYVQLNGEYGDDFTPNLQVEWEDISLDTILSMTDLESQWTFNIPL